MFNVFNVNYLFGSIKMSILILPEMGNLFSISAQVPIDIFYSLKRVI